MNTTLSTSQQLAQSHCDWNYKQSEWLVSIVLRRQLRQSTIPAGDLVHPDVLAHIGTGGAPATGVIGVWTRGSGSRWRVGLVGIRIRRRSGWVRIGIRCRLIGTRIWIRCRRVGTRIWIGCWRRTYVRVVLSARTQIRNYDDRARIRTRRGLGWRIRPRLRTDIVVLLAALDDSILDLHIACQCVHIDRTGNRLGCFGSSREHVDGHGRRCGRRCVLEALHCDDTATHQCADPHQEEEQK
jgi:hypothetical protein